MDVSNSLLADCLRLSVSIKEFSRDNQANLKDFTSRGAYTPAMTQLSSLPAMPAAAAYIALLTIALLPLTFSVMRLRMVTGTGIGDGGHERLAKAIRVHANYSENIPFGVALLLLLALIGSPVWAVHALGLGLIIGRAAHALGLGTSSGPSPARSMGIMLTQFSLLFGAAMVLWQALG